MLKRPKPLREKIARVKISRPGRALDGTEYVGANSLAINFDDAAVVHVLEGLLPDYLGAKRPVDAAP
jgi:hypothetical protein